MTQNPTSSAEVFLKMSDQFRLGDLPTEQSHPLTRNLSELSQKNLAEAIDVMKRIDLSALNQLHENSDYLTDLDILKQNVEMVIRSGHRIFLCGCGATGRLSLTLESLWRQSFPGSESVVSFMAGGDIALVHAIEGFEDHPEFGARQLLQLGFSENDLLICTTEGGETPFVIGAALAAADISRHPVGFLFCNPRALLEQKLERCRKVLQHPQVHAIEVCVGPMALSGSTRLQASSVLMLSVGLALLPTNDTNLETEIKSLIQWIDSINFLQLKGFIQNEAELYQKGERVIYQTGDLAISVFTDTTERAPTFSLQAFQNQMTNDASPSWSFIEQVESGNAFEAWKRILYRRPRFLNWSDVNKKTTEEYLLSFDFSRGATERRRKIWPEYKIENFLIHEADDVMSWKLRDQTAEFKMVGASLLFKHLLVKMLLNIHSTLLMGRLCRYEGNWMTYVYPTNAKLIDRAARYVLGILKQEGIEKSYEEVIRAIFKKLPFEKRDASVVLELVAELRNSI